MSAEPVEPIRPARRARRGADERLRLALQALTGGHGAVIRHEQTAWASITFSGTRHAIWMQFEGVDAMVAGEAMIADLPEHEFTIPGQLVADATIVSVEHAMLPEPGLQVKCELLLLVDA